MSSVLQRRIALEVATMLPDSLADALAVLDYARELIEGVHSADDSTARPSNVLSLVPKPPPDAA
jgi:hypothetical protein